MKARLEFPAEPGHKALTLHWWHTTEANKVFEKHGAKPGGNTLFIGKKGTITAGFDGYSAKMFDGSAPAKPEESIAPSPGFHKEWINACKGGVRATCDFVDYSGPLAEATLLANTAYRAGGGFDWNAAKLKASGNAKVDDYIFSEFREGWKV